jgi:AGZA family xanthine/uracil permease-like MFS transporter
VDAANIAPAVAAVGLHLPVPVFGDLLAGLRHPLAYQYLIPVMLPMGLFNVLGSLQNIESAEAAGDTYPTMPSLAVNGIGSAAAAAFGSCFPTTIYIGHPGWKGLGARTGYSILNGVFFTVVALLGLTAIIHAFVPIEAGMAIVLWIGIVITAQAFETTPRHHASAVAVGLFPAIAAWGLLILQQTLTAASIATEDRGLASAVLDKPGAFSAAGLHLDGLVAISQGFMLTCMIWAAISTCLLDKKYRQAAVWALAGGVVAFFGFIHAGKMTAAGAVYDIGWATGLDWAIGYALVALYLLAMEIWVKRLRAQGGEPVKPGA